MARTTATAADAPTLNVMRQFNIASILLAVMSGEKTPYLSTRGSDYTWLLGIELLTGVYRTCRSTCCDGEDSSPRRPGIHI